MFLSSALIFAAVLSTSRGVKTCYGCVDSDCERPIPEVCFAAGKITDPDQFLCYVDWHVTADLKEVRRGCLYKPEVRNFLFGCRNGEDRQHICTICEADMCNGAVPASVPLLLLLLMLILWCRVV